MKTRMMVLAIAALAGGWAGAAAGELESAKSAAEAALKVPVSQVLKEIESLPVEPVVGKPIPGEEAGAQGRDPWRNFPVSALQGTVDACVQNKPPVEDVEEFMKVYGKCFQRNWQPYYIQQIWIDEFRDGLMIQCGRAANQDLVEKANGLITVPGKRASGLLRIIVDARRDDDRPGRDR